MNLRYLWILAIIFILLVPRFSFADDSSWEGDGYTVMPLSNAQIQLVSEKIKITEIYSGLTSSDFQSQNWLINAELIFKNLGKSTSIQMGFPIESSEEGDFPQNLKTWVNGVSVTTTIKKGVPNPALAKFKPPIGPFGEVYAFNIKFRKGQEIKIKHVYTVGGYADDEENWNVNYILRTGALWKGPIKDIRIELKADPYPKAPFIVMPGGYSSEIINNPPYLLKKLVLHWHFKNIKPDNDIIISGINMRAKKDIDSEDLNKSYFNTSGSFDKNKIWGDEGIIIYLRNLIFAHYGYPFKDALVRSWFYYQGSPYKEDPHFSANRIPDKFMRLADYIKNVENAIEECKHLAKSKEITKYDVSIIANKYKILPAQIWSSCCNPMLYGKACDGDWSMW